MTESELFTPQPDDTERMIDRLVDGELSAGEYRSLVAALDHQAGEPAGNAALGPDVWRRVALAFLEAQALRQELAVLVHPQAATSQHKETLRTTPTGARPTWVAIAAIAASFLVAFGLGAIAPGWIERTARQFDIVARPSGEPAVVQKAAGSAQSPIATQLLEPVGMARLVLNGPEGSRTESENIPIYHLADETAAWPGAVEPALSAYVIDELQRRGHTVERHEQFVPVSLGDGREAVIPIEQYQITPVSRRAY